MGCAEGAAYALNKEKEGFHMETAIPVLDAIGVDNSAALAFSLLFFVNQLCYNLLS